MTIEQLGNLAKNRYPNNPEYKGKSDREIGEMLTVKHRAYRGRKKVDFAKKVEPEVKEEKKFPHMPEGYKPEGEVMYDRPIGPEPAPEKEEKGIPGLIGVGTGLTKGAASSILGLASLPKKGGEALAGMITSMMGMDKSVLEEGKKIQSIREKVEATGVLEGKNKYEKFGKGLEQLAEFFAPTPAGKSKGVAEGLKILNKLKKPTSVTKLITKTAPVVSRAVKEGAKFGGVVAVQEGEIEKEAREAAMIGVAFPVVGAVIGRTIIPAINKVGSAIKEKTQKMVWEGMLHRSADEIIGNPIAIQTAKLSIIAPSRKAIKTKVEKNLESLFNEVRDLTAVSKKTVNVENLRTNLFNTLNQNEQLRKGIKETDPIHELAKMLSKRRDIDNIIREVLPIGKKELTMKEAFQLQLRLFREIERNIEKTEPAITKLKVLLAKGLKDDINKLMPEIKTANDKVSVLAQVLPAIERAMVTEKTAFPVNQLDVITGLGGYAVGAGVLPILAKKSIEQPIIQTAVSRILNTFNGLPNPEKGKFYLGIKGILAGYVEEVIRKD